MFFKLFLCILENEKRTETGFFGSHGPEEKNQTEILQSDQSIDWLATSFQSRQQTLSKTEKSDMLYKNALLQRSQFIYKQSLNFTMSIPFMIIIEKIFII